MHYVYMLQSRNFPTGCGCRTGDSDRSGTHMCATCCQRHVSCMVAKVLDLKPTLLCELLRKNCSCVTHYQ